MSEQVPYTQGLHVDLGIMLAAIELSGAKVRPDVIERVERAVNHHDEMVAALREIALNASDDGPTNDDVALDQIRRIARVALARVPQESPR